MIQLDLKPEIEARLIAQATARGLPVEQYLQTWIEISLLREQEQPNSSPEVTSSHDWAELLERFCNNPALANVPPLSDEAISRESIYREREDSQL